MKRKLLLIVASMLISGAMFAQDFYWEGWDYHAFRYHFNIIGRVYFDDELQSRPNIEIATFVDGELRGTKYLVEPYPNVLPGEYYAWNGCYYDALGETFTFMAYDHDNNILYDICDTELIGRQDPYGNMDEPIQMHFTRTVEPTYGPDYPWVPSTAYNGEGMIVTAQIKINGELVDRETYEVGAFCGEECRGNSGSALDDWTDLDLGYFAFMTVMGNDGDIINFYLYDHESESIFQGVCNRTVTMENGGEVGIDIMGGDIFVLNFVTEQTFTKEIAAYTEKGGYYLIASPIGSVSPTEVGQMLDNNFDLYYFDQSQELEWINYFGEDGNVSESFGNLEPGKGFLYANSQDVTLTFTGYPYTGDGQVTLTKTECDFSGLNLVGNPFAELAYIEDGRDFYTMHSNGAIIVEVNPEDRGIEAMQGVFVVATADDETITFTTTEPANNDKAMLVLNLSNGRALVDRAVVRFGEDRVLPKFQLNRNSTKLYIPMEGQDYAVVSSEGMGEMPVNFKAEKSGSYNLSFNAEEVSFSYLHLIDNLTGNDVDLLANPSYNFDASITDYESRFKLVFATGNVTDDNFVFYSNGSWIINNDGKAIVQLVDVTGRIMKSEQIEGSYSLNFQAAPGVYIFRLINGDNMRVQKVVVK